mgnify:CR=1 FL=1
MAMTMTQKILAAHAGLSEVKPGQLIEAKLDLVLGNDITSPVAIREFKKFGCDCVFDCDKVALVPDHFTPNKDIKAAEQCKTVREFANKMNITNYFEVGEVGIEHALLPEKGLVVAGDAVIGADSHTCTYGALGAFSTGVGSTDMAAAMATGKAWFKVPAALKFNLYGKKQGYVSGKDVILHIIGMIGVDGALYKSMEFTGEGLADLTMDDRLCMANMAIEAGGKNGIFPVDDLTKQYMEKHSKRPYVIYEADEDAEYEQEFTIDLSTLKPTVAFPHLPENTHTIDEVGEIKIDQVVIGSCTNGRMDDLRVADAITEIFNLFKRCNKYIDETMPWALAKDESKKERLATVLYNLVESISIGASLLEPFMPETADKILAQLGARKRSLEVMNMFGLYQSGNKVTDKPEILFARLDVKEVLEKVEAKKAADAAEQDQPEEGKEEAADVIDNEPKAEITFDDFAKLQFQVGEIIACEAVKKSKKLLCSQVRIGSQVKQIVSGIKSHYTPEEMVGKKVMVVVNLKPAKLAGILSEGMLLCAEDAEGNLALMTPEKDMPAGAEIC